MLYASAFKKINFFIKRLSFTQTDAFSCTHARQFLKFLLKIYKPKIYYYSESRFSPIDFFILISLIRHL